MTEQQGENSTHFGFKTVEKQEKASLVRDVFDRVAGSYDIMNDVMSLGLHRRWKEALIDWLNPTPSMHMLDVAGGTGDIAFRILDRLGDAPRSGNMTLCDINYSMLKEGRLRAVDKNRIGQMEWLCADAQTLPLPDRRYDSYTIAFGIRNVTDIPLALAEAYRVLKPGGHFLCLEFSRVEPDILRKLYDAYSFNLIPRFGQWIAGESEPYRYLVESIRRFPDQKTFAGMIETAGFNQVSYRNYEQGVVAIHSGWRV